MDVANYCEGLDPTYSTLGFENAEVLYCGGECCAICPKYVFFKLLSKLEMRLMLFGLVNQ